MPTVRIARSASVQDTADALRRDLGDRYEVTTHGQGPQEALKVKQSSAALATVHLEHEDKHLSTRALVDHLCDEASFAHWEQDTSELPDWQTCWRRLVSNGESAALTHASDANESRAFPAPVEPPPSLT
jgi:hypothetical protein